LKAISEVLTSGAPTAEKQGAVLALAESNSPDAERLLGGLMDDLSAGRLPPEVQLDVYEAAKKRPGLAGKVQQWKIGLPTSDPLANYKLSLYGGDAVRGKKVFREHAQAQCFKCHKAEGGDSLVGPDLTKIGAQKDRAYILGSIVFPNKEIAQGFQIVVLELKDGSTVAGRLLAESAANLQVETVDDKGKPQIVTVTPDKIKNRIGAPSPMPETLREQLSRSELRDVVEYLATRK
jgi:quinoprotein glucose dehydrogenase